MGRIKRKVRQLFCRHKWTERRVSAFFRLTDMPEGPGVHIERRCIKCGKQTDFWRQEG